jgi:hypothetical protein
VNTVGEPYSGKPNVRFPLHSMRGGWTGKTRTSRLLHRESRCGSYRLLRRAGGEADQLAEISCAQARWMKAR